MLVDIITIALLLMALYKGWRRGLIVAVLSFLALVLGVIAALKLSAVTARWLEGSVNVSAKWMPVLAFLVVFIAVVVLVNIIARMLEHTAEMLLLGGLNKVGGILLYSLGYMICWSILLFYIGKTNLINAKTLENSFSYPLIAPWGPRLTEAIGTAIPALKDMFADLSRFFGLF